MKPEIYIPLIVIVLGCISIILAILTRKKNSPPSVDSIVGLEAKVISQIDNLSGAVKVKGTEWSARSTSDEDVIEEGKTVTILAVEGVQLIVK